MAGLRVALVGATGAVGNAILEVLDERRFPVDELCAFASTRSEGIEIEFGGEEHRVRLLDDAEVARCELVFCAAPGALRPLLPTLAQSRTLVVDVSGVLEQDASVPLYRPGVRPGGARRIAVPRGIAGPLGLGLGALTEEAELRAVSLVSLEAAAGAGRSALSELADHTIEMLSQMTGERPESEVFPSSLAFDCLPIVGDLLAGGETSGERELAAVLRRLLDTPDLPVQLTRVRVPTFSGSLAIVHATFSRGITAERAGELWRAHAGLRVFPKDVAPSARAALGGDDILIGRVRAGSPTEGGLAFALAVDDLRRGAALSAVEAAELLLAQG